MQSYISVGYKSKFDIFIYLFLGLALLVLINLSIVLYVKQQQGLGYYIFFIFFAAYFFYKLYKKFIIRYEFSDKGISIMITRHKKINISIKDIENIQKIDNINYMRFFFDTYNATSKELFCLTSNQNILRIDTKQGDKIYISPKKISDETFNLIKK